MPIIIKEINIKINVKDDQTQENFNNEQIRKIIEKSVEKIVKKNLDKVKKELRISQLR